MDPIFTYVAPATDPASGGAPVSGYAAAIEARKAPGGRSGAGPLSGLRIALQPGISVRGWPTEAGSTALAGYTALEDATVVGRMRDAGATLQGFTHASEFGLGLQGSRAGAAVQEDAADLELVLDHMGECRLAASRAGVCGFKPSYGLVSRQGLIGLIPSMECCGLVSRSAESIRATLEVIAGQDGLDYSLPHEEAPDLSLQTVEAKKTTIGVVTEALATLSAEQAEAFRAALGGLKALGFSVRELSLPEFELFSLVHRIVGSVEASSAAGRYDSVRYGPRAPGAKNWNEMYLLSRGAAFGTLVKSHLIQGAFFQFERYGAFEDACRIRARLVKEMERLTSEVDFLALPLDGAGPRSNSAAAGAADGAQQTGDVAAAPVSLDDLYAGFSSALFANVTGQPAMYVPPGPAAAAGAGAGLQLVGPRLSDGRLLALGALLLDADRGGE